MNGVVSAAHDDGNFVFDIDAFLDLNACDRGFGPGLSETGVADAPLQFGAVLVGNVQSVIRCAAAAHAEDDVNEVTVGRFDLAIVILVKYDRDNVAVDTVVFAGRRRVEEQLGQVRRMLLRDESPQLLAGRAVDGMYVALIGRGENDGDRIFLSAAVDNCGRL